MLFRRFRRLRPYSVIITVMMVGALLLVKDHMMEEKFTQMMNGTKHCQKLQFGNPSSQSTALVSYPGSGNTWLRHLIQEVTGLFTGSIYIDEELGQHFPGETISNGRVVVFKTHERSKKMIASNRRVILLVRNPFRATMAEYSRQWANSSHRATVVQTFNWTQGVRDFYLRNLQQWFNFHEAWLTRTEPMLVVTYEDLKKDIIHEMRRIIKFLNLKASDDILKCMAYNSEGQYHRKSIPTGANIFSREMVSVTRKYIDILNKIMKQKYGVAIDGTIPVHHTD